jgi:hypothetical protein
MMNVNEVNLAGTSGPTAHLSKLLLFVCHREKGFSVRLIILQASVSLSNDELINRQRELLTYHLGLSFSVSPATITKYT